VCLIPNTLDKEVDRDQILAIDNSDDDSEQIAAQKCFKLRFPCKAKGSEAYLQGEVLHLENRALRTLRKG
jgi:hypothetical protein